MNKSLSNINIYINQVRVYIYMYINIYYFIYFYLERFIFFYFSSLLNLTVR